MANREKEYFLLANDSLGTFINEKANELYASLKNFDTNSIEVDKTYRDYFINHHLGNRLFFSLQNSAHILYGSIKKTGRPIAELNAIDYGAGLGTLFLLGGMLGFKRFVYNDYLPDWNQTATAVCTALGIKIDAYVTGDIDAVMSHAKQYNIQYDIIASRNVIEHIYSLPGFYTAIYQHNKNAVTYSTTTANFHNPAMRLYHYLIHKKVERKYNRQKRSDTIKRLAPALSAARLTELTSLTRGKAADDLLEAVNRYLDNKPIIKDSSLRSNTCDCETGVWNEHLLTKKEHEKIVADAGFKMSYMPGYCDTHYTSVAMNVLAFVLNKIILITKDKGVLAAPFVNIVAYN